MENNKEELRLLRKKEYEKRYRERNKESLNKRHLELYYKNRERYLLVNNEWKKNNLDYRLKHATRARTRLAVKRGILKEKPCEVCGSLKVQAHHTDYTKHLEVMWLCQKHHGEQHIKERSLTK